MKTTGINGQWKANLVRRSDVGPFLEANVQQANGDFVCQVYGGKPDTVRTADEADTIARAIAEVPAMIEAIESLMERCEFFLKRDPDDDTKQAYVDASAILRRIEGGE